MPSGWRARYLRYQEVFLNIINVYRRRRDVKMFLEIILSASTVAFFSFFALRPTAVTIAQLIRDVGAKEETVRKMDEKIQNLGKAHLAFSSEASAIGQIDFSVPTKPSPETLVRQFEALALTRSTNILGISIGEITLLGPTKPKSDEGKEKLPEGAFGVPFSVSVSGDYPQLQNFLADMERLRRPIKIDTVGVSSTNQEGVKILILVTSGRVPYLGDENE